jgi:hypothetical protein
LRVPDGEPVAWRVIEPGWDVVDADGNSVGKVDQLTGDVEGDIFDGLTFGDGGTILTRARYVPAEHISSIFRGRVVLDLHADDVAKLSPYEAPVSEPLADLLPERDDEGSQAGRRPGGFLGRLFRGPLGPR